MTEAQKDSLVSWDDSNRPKFLPVQEFHQARAAQLRRVAGLLAAVHSARGISAGAFQKEPWQAPDTGYFPPNSKNDRGPAASMTAITDRYQEQLEVYDAAHFRLNFVRVQVEAHEDLAQEAADADSFLTVKFADLERQFQDPNYAGVLVRTSDTWAPEGSGLAPEPRHRVHPLDPPTLWERYNAGHALS